MLRLGSPNRAVAGELRKKSFRACRFPPLPFVVAMKDPISSNPNEPEMPSTIKLHRVFKTTPERLYKAFIDPQAMVKWLPPHGFTGKVDKRDGRGGGGYP